MAIQAVAISLKDKDGNAGQLIGLSQQDITKLNTAVALTKTNKDEIDKLKQKIENKFPNIDTSDPIDLSKVAKLDVANTFTAENTFSQNVTMSVVQDDIDAIEDQHLVTGKALKAIAKQAGGAANIEWSANGAPNDADMKEDTIYFYAASENITS